MTAKKEISDFVKGYREITIKKLNISKKIFEYTTENPSKKNYDAKILPLIRAFYDCDRRVPFETNDKN